MEGSPTDTATNFFQLYNNSDTNARFIVISSYQYLNTKNFECTKSMW